MNNPRSYNESRPRRHSQLRGGVQFFVAVTVTLFFHFASAQGATITVVNPGDSGPGTLRQAIFDAFPGDTINFAFVGTIALSSELLIDKNIAIEGPGQYAISIHGGQGFRVFHIASASVNTSISGLAIRRGFEPVDAGGILNAGTLVLTDCRIIMNTGRGIANSGTLTVTNCSIGGNRLVGLDAESAHGAGIANTGTLTVSGSTIDGNNTESHESYGAGIANTGTATITSSTISNNRCSNSGQAGVSQNRGGGIANFGNATMVIANSNISLNQCFDYDPGESSGGGIANFGSATLTITNTTISSNQSAKGQFSDECRGGGVANLDDAMLTLVNSTVAGNVALRYGGPPANGGGIFAGGGTVTTRNTIIARNDAPIGPDANGPLVSQGFNLVGNNADAAIAPQTADQVGTPGALIDPLLGSLQDNGGPTQTRALLPGSLAINKGHSSGSVTDQRGFPRPADIAAVEGGDGSDIGAIEVQPPATLGNISTRLRVETGDNVLIGGFIVTGTQAKKVIVRAIGPSLSDFFAGTLADPTLELRDSSGGLVSSNNNWRSSQEAEIIASGVPPSDDLESAIVATLPAGGSAYTATVRGVNDGTGIGVVEAYDLDQTVDSTLANISTRGLVETGDDVLIAGTIVLGQGSKNVLVRAIGPSLPVTGRLENPRLELRDGNGALIRANDNWRSDQEKEIIATTIPPTNDLESALVEVLPSNGAAYTAIVRGVGGTGVAVVEVYGLK